MLKFIPFPENYSHLCLVTNGSVQFANNSPCQCKRDGGNEIAMELSPNSGQALRKGPSILYAAEPLAQQLMLDGTRVGISEREKSHTHDAINILFTIYLIFFYNFTICYKRFHNFAPLAVATVPPSPPSKDGAHTPNCDLAAGAAAS